MEQIREEIARLKQEKHAVILAHYYVPDEVQQIADIVGDSFQLSRAAQKTDADIIVFCGVSFMGESAKILNPGKKVLMPDLAADCAMAHMVAKEKIAQVRAENDDLAVVCYINSTAEIKTASDVCVTSSNALRIVRALPEKNIFFIPDGNLGRFIAEQVPEKHFIFNDGYCPVHQAMTAAEVAAAKEKHPNAQFLVHPEARMEVVELADYAGSTAGIIDYATKSDAKEFIIGTEIGVMCELKKQNTDKRFYPLREEQICRDMKLVTLEKVLEVLRTECNEVIVSDALREQSLRPLRRMLELAK